MAALNRAGMKEFKFLSLNRTKEGYEYAERKGVHSVAFVVYNPDTKMVLLRNEYKPPINAWILGAFGGSLDKRKSLAQIVVEECKEEIGLDTTLDMIEYVGKYFVSTQMNQYCYLYVVQTYASADDLLEPSTEDGIEQLSSNHWVNIDIKHSLECWKARLILNRIKQ